VIIIERMVMFIVLCWMQLKRPILLLQLDFFNLFLFQVTSVVRMDPILMILRLLMVFVRVQC